jgi:hypothetical protein
MAVLKTPIFTFAPEMRIEWRDTHLLIPSVPQRDPRV